MSPPASEAAGRKRNQDAKDSAYNITKNETVNAKAAQDDREDAADDALAFNVG